MKGVMHTDLLELIHVHASSLSPSVIILVIVPLKGGKGPIFGNSLNKLKFYSGRN
jgi:hypothetical protein